MTRDDVIRMAREAKFPVNHPDWADAAVRFAALVAADSRAARIAAQTENEALKAERAASGVAERRAVREATAHLTAQRDELLAALKAICDEQDERQGYASCEAYDKARAAIAKVEP